MLAYLNRPASKLKLSKPLNDFHGVEFTVSTPHPIYQFKIWRTQENNMFFLIKNGSNLLQELKKGKILPMKYISGNGTAGCQVRRTQIKDIINEVNGRFRGHHRIELTVFPEKNADMVH